MLGIREAAAPGASGDAGRGKRAGLDADAFSVPATSEAAAVLTAVKDKPFGWPPMAAILDRRSTRQRHRYVVGTEEWLRRGRT